MLAGVLLQFHKLEHKCLGNCAYPPGSSSIFGEKAPIMDESWHFWTYNATWSNISIFKTMFFGAGFKFLQAKLDYLS